MIGSEDASHYVSRDVARKSDVRPDDFFAVDMRAGLVVAAENFPEARIPAVKLEVDFGPSIGVLQTSAQITNYSLDELRGQMVVGAINLGTKKIAGFTSEFLVLGSYDPDGTVRLLRVEEGVQPGAPIG